MNVRTLVVLSSALVAVACSGADYDPSKGATNTGGSGISVSSRADSLPASPATVGGDSVAITTTDGSVVLALARDTVAMGLSPAALAKVRRETDTTGGGNGIGALIERTVKSGVASMLRRRIAVPVTDIEDVRYEAGAIRFSFRRDPGALNFEEVKVNDRPSLESFREADARLFVDSVRARLRSQ